MINIHVTADQGWKQEGEGMYDPEILRLIVAQREDMI